MQPAWKPSKPFQNCRASPLATVHPDGFLMPQLRNLHLTHLDLSNCKKLTDSGLEAFRGDSTLISLGLSECTLLTAGGLQSLRGLPLSLLNLRDCAELGSPVALEHLQELPLASLDLGLHFNEDILPLDYDAPQKVLSQPQTFDSPTRLSISATSPQIAAR